MAAQCYSRGVSHAGRRFYRLGWEEVTRVGDV